MGHTYISSKLASIKKAYIRILFAQINKVPAITTEDDVGPDVSSCHK